MSGYRRGPDSRDPGYRVLMVVLFVGAFALGACGPLWDAMPWAVGP